MLGEHDHIRPATGREEALDQIEVGTSAADRTFAAVRDAQAVMTHV
jgi:hypothetical protein